MRRLIDRLAVWALTCVFKVAPQIRRRAMRGIIRALITGEAYRHGRYILPALSGAAGDFIAFNEGRQRVETTGWPSTVYFRLSTKPTQGSGTFVATDTYSGGFGEITGTGYAEASQSRPSSTGLGQLAFTQMSWSTGSATDWGSPKSIIAIDKSAGGGSEKIVCAWDLVAGGAARDMSLVNTTLNVTPTYAPTNP